MKSKKQLESFTEYCKSHPNLRFYQALQSWSGYNFIFGSMTGLEEGLDNLIGLEDTYYKD